MPDREHPPGSLRKGSKLGKYVLTRRLGRGAFAEVWEATDTVEGHPIALKVAFPDAVQEFGRAEIEREARIAARLHHRNIVSVRNADWVGNRFIIATELARRNLAEYPSARRSARIALEVVRQVAAALAYAHRRRILHRDVKPQNILIFDDGRAALGDFGASCFAKPLGHTYSEVGTLGYMAPEQAYGRPSQASDIFPLGVIAYELLTGVLLKWPFEWPPEGHRRLERKVHPAVIRVVRKAVQFQPHRRYQDGASLLAALEAALREAETERKPARPVRRRRKPPPSPLQVEAALFKRAHGARLGMRYQCSRCEGPIAEEMHWCPWCGNEDNSFIEITSYPLVCYACERGVKPEWSYCPWCYQGRFEPNGRRPRPDPRAVRRCSRKGCEGELRPFMRYCPICKQKTKRPWSDPELGHRCPRCRWSVSKESWRHCPWCGRREPRAGHFVASRRTQGRKTRGRG